MENLSPCLRCRAVPDPELCNDKNCLRWRRWFVARWDAMRGLPRQAMEKQTPQPLGVKLAGRVYAAPDQVRAYLTHDPCQGCLFPKKLCTAPCPDRRAWEHAREVTV